METCAQEKKEYAQEQTKLKWEKDNALKQLKKSQLQLEVLTESARVSRRRHFCPMSLFKPEKNAYGVVILNSTRLHKPFIANVKALPRFKQESLACTKAIRGQTNVISESTSIKFNFCANCAPSVKFTHSV